MPRLNARLNLPWARKAAAFEGMVVKDKFYNSTAWRRFRHGYIARHPLCRACYAKGITTAAKVVDHITPINQGGEKFDEMNLQPLCDRCHNVKSVNDRWGKGASNENRRI